MRTFPDILPKRGLTPSVKFRVLTSQFGDGYSQRGRDGINNRQDRWPLTFEMPEDMTRIVLAFLDDHGGDMAFQWAPPDEPLGMFTCKKYSGPREIAPDYYVVKATFDRVFDL